jgi:general secretion pathway protein G
LIVTVTCMKNIKGLSFIELSISVLILGIIAAATFPVIRVSERKTKEIELRAVLREMRGAIDKYYDVNNKFPKSLEELTKKDKFGNRYLRRIPIDPLTGNRKWFTISSSDDEDNFIRLFSDKNDVYDVRSLSDKKSLSGVPYNEW